MFTKESWPMQIKPEFELMQREMGAYPIRDAEQQYDMQKIQSTWKELSIQLKVSNTEYCSVW